MDETGHTGCNYPPTTCIAFPTALRDVRIPAKHACQADITPLPKTPVMTPHPRRAVPTFIGFLKDVESPYEVRDYVSSYLGDNKEAGEFARQFVERRSRWKNATKQVDSDDMYGPARAVNPATNEFQEAKVGRRGWSGGSIRGGCNRWQGKERCSLTYKYCLKLFQEEFKNVFLVVV